jgi:hypothetical protein
MLNGTLIFYQAWHSDGMPPSTNTPAHLAVRANDKRKRPFKIFEQPSFRFRVQDCLFHESTGFAGKRFLNPIYLLLFVFVVNCTFVSQPPLPLATRRLKVKFSYILAGREVFGL